MGVLLKELDDCLHAQNDPLAIDAVNATFLGVLRKIADKRHLDQVSEEKCYQRLSRDAKRFQRIYRERAGKLIQRFIVMSTILPIDVMKFQISTQFLISILL